MRRNLLPALLPFALFFAACSPYQYFTLSGNNVQKNEKNELVFENDTVKVAYNFNGSDAPLSFSIYNKTDKPLTLNWKKSAIVVNDSASSLYSPTYQLNATATRTLYTRPAATRVEGEITGSDEISFIPPRSAITRTALPLPVKPLPDHLFDSLKKNHLKLNNDVEISYKRLTFQPQASPVSVRSYLTFAIDNKEFMTENTFFVTEVWQTATNPLVFSDPSGDKFYLHE